MTTNSPYKSVIVVLMFALSFALIGWTAPVLYATHAPNDHFIETHSFEAQNVSPSADKHYVCFDRTVHQPTNGVVYTELYLVNGGDERIEVDTQQSEQYFQEGRHMVVTPLDLPDDLSEGTYRYVLVVELQLADGRVERQFVFESTTFEVGEEYSDRPMEENGNTCSDRKV